jgi:hypothetical protein
MGYSSCIRRCPTKRLHLLQDISCVGGKFWAFSLAFGGCQKNCFAMGIKQKRLVDGENILPTACVMMG